MQFIYQHLGGDEVLGGSEQLPEDFDVVEEVLGLENLSAADLIEALDDYSEAELEAMGTYLAEEEASLTTGQMRLKDELSTELVETKEDSEQEAILGKLPPVRKPVFI